jgi:hypothetical protein
MIFNFSALTVFGTKSEGFFILNLLIHSFLVLFLVKGRVQRDLIPFFTCMDRTRLEYEPLLVINFLRPPQF